MLVLCLCNLQDVYLFYLGAITFMCVSGFLSIFDTLSLSILTGSAENVESDEPMAKKARADALNSMMYPVMAGMGPGMGAMVMPGMPHMSMMPGMGMMPGG